MAQEADPAELIELRPDPRLLGENRGALPAEIEGPVEIPPSALRPVLVGLGATLTGVTLIGGIALIALGLVLLIADGLGAGAIAALAAGIVFVSTHWGWVHVAELTSVGLERRGNRELVVRRDGWLEEIEPYVRFAVRTHAHDDGAIEIVTTRHRPVRSSPSTFTFERETIASERHHADEPAAAVAERAELLRAEAAGRTAHERARYTAARAAWRDAQLRDADEQERRAAARAASQALTEQINANLRSPPLE